MAQSDAPGAAGDERGLAGEVDAWSLEELLHLVRGAERQRRGPRDDPLEQARQHVAGADLDERRARNELPRRAACRPPSAPAP